MSKNKQTSEDISTRERLLQAAVKSFGHNDYNAVSTREIVEKAGANISAISYHFGGKKGLYLATAEYLADRIHGNMEPLLAEINSQMQDSGSDESKGLLTLLINGFVANLLTGEVSEDAAGLIFREQNHPTEAFDFLYDKFMHPMHRTFASLVSRITGTDPDAKETKLLTHSLLGQIVIFRMGRETIMRQLGITKFTTDDVTQIAQLICESTLLALSNRSQ